MTTQRSSLLGLIASILFAGCSGSSLSYTVDVAKLKDMSREGQIWIYDAENEIVVALDRLDEAKDDLALIRHRKKQAEDSLEAAEKRNNRLGVEMADEWIKYLEAMERWAKARIKAAQVGITSALAAVELAKAQVINREDLVGGKGFSIRDFQEQHESWKKDFEAERKNTNRLRKAARDLETKWWTLRKRFIAQTGDYDSGLWTE